MTELPSFRGSDRIASVARAGQPPDHIGLVATDDGPAVLVSGMDGTYLIPVHDGLDVTDDPTAFREHGENAILVGVVAESAGLRPEESFYSRVRTLYVLDETEAFHEEPDDYGGVVNANYTAVHEGYVNPTSHNHRHLVSDPDENVTFVLFGVGE